MHKECAFFGHIFMVGHSIIAYNGDFIIEPDTRKILSKEAFNRTQTEEVMDVMRQNNLSPLVYSFVDGVERVSWLAGTENEGKQSYLDSGKGDKRLRPVRTEEELYAGEVLYDIRQLMQSIWQLAL